jgi:hypothetical protein
MWSDHKVFRSADGDVITMLRRILEDLPEATRHELRPFFDLPSLFERRGEAHAVKELMKGKIGDLYVSEGKVVLSIRSGSTSTQWELQDLQSTVLTVWRVNEKLDALQVRFHALLDDVYMQTGGQHLLGFFQESEVDANPNTEIANAQSLFLDQTLYK